VRATIWGCRGSLATPGPATVRYGGNTSSVEVRTREGDLVVLDAGTGIRGLGWALGADAPARIHLLLTHLHLDHVEGLGFFAPIFDERCELTIWGPRQADGSLRERIVDYLSPPLFPLRFEQLPSRIEVTEVWEDTWEVAGLTVRSAPVRHPGPTLGYRLEENGTALAYVPDNEPALDPESGLVLAAGATVLLHDAQYTTDEYASRVGWGHTDLSHFGDYVQAAGAERTLMFHHDPAHADAALERMRDEAADRAGQELELAREGLELDLG
jgi:phosphoribosyl 1,2-cyclic phosphodiesterase